MVNKRVKQYQNNFTKGEIDRSLWGHGDLKGYYEGLASAENVWVNGIGSVAKRYGLERVHSYEDSACTKMYPFDIVSGSHYIAVVRAGRIDVINGGSLEMVASMPADVFSEGIVPDLYGLAYQDSVIFTHNNLAPQQFKWVGGNEFTLSAINFSNVPTFEYRVNDAKPGVSIKPSGAAGYISAVSSGKVFEASDVGKYVTMLPIGRLRITRVNSATSVNGYLEENLFDSASIAAGDWTIERGWELLWGAEMGYPGVVGFHEDRMLLGNYPRARSVFAYSMINSPFDFSIGDGTAGYGGWRILAYDQGEVIRHIVSEHALYFFCAKGEYVIDQSSGEQLSRARIRHDSDRGTVASVGTRPVTGEDGSLYFFQQNSTSLSEFRYYDERGSYEAHSMSRYARHLLVDPSGAALWKGDKTFDTNILFYVNSDGSMVACTINLVEKIVAFSRIVSGRVFTGVCVSGNSVYVCVEEAGICSIMVFAAGNYFDDGVAYESKIVLLPISDETSSHIGMEISVTAVHVYVSGSGVVVIGGAVVYDGVPITGKFSHYYPSGWDSDGKISVSDGSGAAHWQVNNVGRSALIGGMS